jgi:hypothetical protein
MAHQQVRLTGSFKKQLPDVPAQHPVLTSRIVTKSPFAISAAWGAENSEPIGSYSSHRTHKRPFMREIM